MVAGLGATLKQSDGPSKGLAANHGLIITRDPPFNIYSIRMDYSADEDSKGDTRLRSQHTPPFLNKTVSPKSLMPFLMIIIPIGGIHKLP